MAGSMRLRRKRPADDRQAGSISWFPFTIEPLRRLLEELGRTHRQVILFGEISGRKIRSLHYGFSTTIGFRVFDLLLGGCYVDWPDFLTLCARSGGETLPVLTTLAFDLRDVRRYSEGKTRLMTVDAHMREGVVVRPLRERTDPRVGRVIVKYISDSYLFGEKSDYTEI